MAKIRFKAMMFAALAGLASLPAQAAQMLVLEQPGCPYCAKFEKEIAPIWDKTDEGKKAELRRVDITKDWPEDIEFVDRTRLTPTFVLIDEGKELGRLRGYPGDQYFWYLIDDLLAKLPEKPTNDQAVESTDSLPSPSEMVKPDAAPLNG